MDFGVVRLLGPETVARNNAGTLTDLLTLDGSFTLGAGTATITAGNGAAAGNGGSRIVIAGGDGNTTGAGGSVSIDGGDGGATGNGAAVNLSGGAGGATSGNGGNAVVGAGSAPAIGDGGFCQISAGSGGATSGEGGYVEILAGNAQANNDIGGYVAIYGGNGDGTGDGGFIQLVVGDGGTQGFVELLGANAAPELRFHESPVTGTNYVSFQSPTAMASGSTAYTWPNAYPAADGYVMSSTTAGVLSWTAPGGGGGAGVFRLDFVDGDLTGDDLVISTGLGLAANAAASVVVRNGSNVLIVPNNVTFDATPDQITINLASYRNPTLVGTYQVAVIG